MKKIMSIVLSLALILTCCFGIFFNSYANEAYDYTYVGQGEKGFVVDGNATTLFRVKGPNDTEEIAYCVDDSTFIQLNSKYARQNASFADYYDEETADKIRGIMQNSYPFISLDEVKERSGVSGLDKKEAITATQLAIWKLSNNRDGSFPNADVKALYDWLLALPPVAASSTPVGNIDLQQNVNAAGDQAIYAYKTDGVNVDGSKVELSYSFDKDVVAQYGVTIEDQGVNDQGYNIVKVSNIPQDAQFTFIVTGEQNVEFDGYFYSPEGGRDASQSLIGGFEGKTNLRKSISFFVEKQPGCSIRIKKIDSVTLKGLQGAKFEISKNKDFTGQVFHATTDAFGYATFTGLSSGTWYIREAKTPNGYIPSDEVFTVTVSKKPVFAEIKNTAYGALCIFKVDVAGQGIGGAKFDIYDEDENKIYSDLVSDENGLIQIDNLVPGEYKIVETQAPSGFVPDPNPQTITIKPGMKGTVTFVNERVPITAGNFGRLLLGGGAVLLLGVIVLLIALRKKNADKNK